MTMLTGAVSMSALGLAIHGGAESALASNQKRRNEETTKDKDQDGTSRIH